MMKKINFTILLLSFTFLSCFSTEKYSNDYEKEYLANLKFLKNYFNNKGETFSVNEIEKSILYLESKSGIKSEISGDYIGKFRITENDIKKWNLWFEENCDKENYKE